MPQRRGMATLMVRRMAHTTGSAASGVNAMGQSADSGDRRPSGSRRSSRRAAVYRRILNVLDRSVDGREGDHRGGRRSRLETLGNNDIRLHQFRKVGFEDAKSWMERRLANLRSGIPNSVATQLASGWARQLSPELGDLDERIAEIEASNLARHYARTHVERLGYLAKPRPDGVFRLLGGQMNSAASAETRLRKSGDLVRLCQEFEVQGGGLSEVGVNWSSFPASANLASWLRDDIPDIRAHAAHNRNEGVGHYQPGGTATFACGELVRYMKQKGEDFRGLGRWCSTLFYSDPAHRTRVVAAYNVGRQSPKGLKTIFQQQVRHIQTHGLNTSPARLFLTDFLAQLQVWQRQGDRLLIFMDMNEHVLRGTVARYLLKMGLVEATHQYWGSDEPHTFIGGVDPIDGVWHTPDLEVSALVQLSFHEGLGDHRTVLVDVTTQSAIGKHEFRVIRPEARRLNSTNSRVRSRYISHLEGQMEIHKMLDRLEVCGRSINGFPTSEAVTLSMQRLDTQMEEMQRGSEQQCRHLFSTAMPFSEPVRIYHYRRRAYQGLLNVCKRTARNASNAYRNAIRCGIPSPRLLNAAQCRDGIEACTRRLQLLKGQSVGLRKVHLRDSYIRAKESGDDSKCKDILRIIGREEQKSMWRRINRAVDKPTLGAIPFVQRVENGIVVDISTTDEMNREIQAVTEKRFDLSMSAPITMSSLRTRLGFLSDTDFANSLLTGDVHIPWDVDDVTATVLEEVIRLFGLLREGHGVVEITADHFRYYWRRFKERTSSSISGIHAGHYKSATHSATVTNFLAQKITLIARGGCPPDRWGHGLQVMLEKVAGVALVNKLRAILLMEADFNYMNKWIFGHEAINKMYALNYVAEDQYSQKESTAEDAKLDNKLSMDLSRQLRHPLATMSADADKCYDRINHIVMSLLLLAIIGTVGPVVAMLHPIQTMKFYQRTARGDSKTFMGGRGRDNPLQGLCQGNGAAPACWLIICSVLMHCYKSRGFGSRIISPISGAVIDFLGEIYVDDTDLIVTHPDLETPEAVLECLHSSAEAWSSGLNSTGGAINPDKSRWILASYEWINGLWRYSPQPEIEMTIPLPDGTRAPISNGQVDTAEKSLGVWSAIDGNDSKHIEENVTGKTANWINRMRNAHLPARLGWIAYRFKLWAGIRYGIATLAIPLTESRRILQTENFQCLSFLGINRNVKREWRTLHRAFGGIGLFSFSVEQTIGMINMLIQHYGAGTTLARKITASLEALQLEIGCTGNPFDENYDELQILATACWTKSLWERLHYYKFKIHLDYPLLPLPRKYDALLVRLFWEAGYRGQQLQTLNRCRLALKLIFLSDIATACGRFINIALVMHPAPQAKSVSSFVFPNERPSQNDWQLWLELWTALAGPGWSLRRPLGIWEHTTHRRWDWFYDARDDLLIHSGRDGVIVAYSRPGEGHRLRSRQVYNRSHELDTIPTHCLLANVMVLPGEQILRRETGPPLAKSTSTVQSFWSHLRSMGGEWMWKYVVDEKIDVMWIRDALATGTFLAVTDGSYDRGVAPTVSGSGWIIACTTCKRTLRGSFFEVSQSAGSYRGELLGLVAIHTFATAIAKYFSLQEILGEISCDNMAALHQAGKNRKRVGIGVKHSDLHRTIRTLKHQVQFKFRYKHVKAHQDKLKLWKELTLSEQLNVICDDLANRAIKGYLERDSPNPLAPSLLPLEKAAVFINNEKATTDVGPNARYLLGAEEARRFYTSPRVVVRGVNKGGLGWSGERFNQVAWTALDRALQSKPDMYQLWLSKQCIGICATRRNLARIQDILDDRCPNCCQGPERSSHLNRCPDHGRTMLFKESVDNLGQWMRQKDRTDPELAYWIEKYLLFRGTRSFASLVVGDGYASRDIRVAAVGQDLIGWTEFLHGKVSVEIAAIQNLHCMSAPSCRITGADWMKIFISHLLQISHSQWIFRNYTLHDKRQGYLRLRLRKEVLREIHELLETPPSEVSPECQYLLELDHSALYKATYEEQAYWILAMKAARRAGRRAALSNRARGRSRRRIMAATQGKRLRYNFRALEEQMGYEIRGQKPGRKRPHLTSVSASIGSNKRLRKPD